MQEPWFRRQTWSWYVELDGGRQHRLGKHPNDTQPVKGKKGWNPPEEIREAWHRLMRDGGKLPPGKEPTVAVLFDDFLSFADETTKPKTRDWYLFFLQDFKDRHPALLASSVTEAHVERWLRAKRQRPWGQSSRRGAITALKRVLNWAVKTHRLHENPIRHLQRPAAVRREKILTPAERAAILAFYSEGDPFRDFLIAMQESGARPGEIIRLTAADIDLAAGTATLAEHKTGGKTGRSRVIYLTPTLAGRLKEKMAERPSGPLFLNADGNPWTLQAINCRFRRKRQRKTDPIARDITAYVYRGTWTTEALVNEVPIATVAELLGHTSTQMVSRHYSKLAEKKDYLRRAAMQAVKPSDGP